MDMTVYNVYRTFLANGTCYRHYNNIFVFSVLKSTCFTKKFVRNKMFPKICLPV